MAKNAKKKTYQSDSLDCSFGNVSFGTETCSVGVHVGRSLLELEQIESMVVGSRLEVRLEFDPNAGDDLAGQQKLADTMECAVESVADCKSLTVKSHEYKFGLAFQIKSIDVPTFARVAQKSGRVSLTRIGSSDAAADSDGDE